MDNTQKRIEDLEQLVLNAPDDTVRKIAQEQLDRVKERQKINVDKDFSGVITAINSLIEKTYNSSNAMSNQQIDEAIAERLKKLKINQANLSSELKELIGQTKTTVIQINEIKVSSSSGTRGRRLEDVLMSDAEAQNNVYLFGEAGTGKTFIAGIIADKLNYKLITLNCNQFTSPLDIIGGQTIEGFKEGRLTQAWGNLDLGLNPCGEPYVGALLLLDELPKIDPNTAGILNDGLAKIKDGVKEICDPKKQVPATIMNGNGELIQKKKIFIMATGNSLLNEANKDYEANFKQDLSLQDRFAGSCYKITYNYKFEYEKMMTNVSTKSLPNVKIDLTFAFNFLSQLRMKIVQLELTGVAFVSTRLMIVARDTFVAYIVNRELAPDNIADPKKISEVVMSFMSLFKPDQRDNIKNELSAEFTEFYNMCAVKEALPLDQLNESTKEQKDLAKIIIETAEANYAQDNAIPL
jgi:midasin (ATPase involved in ribosome maturation)